MEEIVFPVPNICEFLTSESKLRVYYTTERDEQGSKINDFFLRAEDLFNEMNWQKKLRGEICSVHILDESALLLRLRVFGNYIKQQKTANSRV